MPNSGENDRFQLLVNGVVKATADMESLGVLTVILDWVRRDLATAPDDLRSEADFDPQDWIGNEINVRLGGLDSTTDEVVSWFDHDLQVGDEITVRVLPPGEFDTPTRKPGRRREG
jgi:hypothetical protein